MTLLLLGKLPPRKDKRNLKLADYLPKKLPAVPKVVAWESVKGDTEWGMDGNDEFGNCVIATAAHILDCSRANESGNLTRITDKQAIAATHRLGAEDGYVILDRLNWWRQKGLWRTHISAFTQVNMKRHDLIKAAIHIFGHCDIGLAMPIAWQDNYKLWDVGTGYKYAWGSWGGHSVPLLGYLTKGDGTLVYQLCTWGGIVNITQAAIATYCDEGYVSILPAWYRKDKKTPSGFNVKQLQADLAEI